MNINAVQNHLARNAAVKTYRGLVCDTVSFTGHNSNYFMNAVKTCKDVKDIEVLLKYMNDEEKTQALLTEDSDIYDMKYIPLDYVLMSHNKQDINKKVKILFENAPDDETRKEMLLHKSYWGLTPLMKTANAGNAELTKILLELAPDDETRKEMLLQKDNSDYNTLMKVIKSGKKDTEQIKILFEAAPDDETRKEMLGKDILSYISGYEKDEVTAEKVKVLLNAVSNNEKKQQLLSYTDEIGFNSLIYAVGKPKTIKVLFDNADYDTILEMVLRLTEYTKKLSDAYWERQERQRY